MFFNDFNYSVYSYAFSIHRACKYKDVEAIKIMLKQKINLNTLFDGEAALHIACLSANIEITELLLFHNADVNITDFMKRTPLHFAISESLAIVKILIKYGANVNAQDSNGRTPLHHACSLYVNLEAVKLLVENRADIYIIDDKGDSIFKSACKSGNAELIEYLGKLLLQNS